MPPFKIIYLEKSLSYSEMKCKKRVIPTPKSGRFGAYVQTVRVDEVYWWGKQVSGQK